MQQVSRFDLPPLPRPFFQTFPQTHFVDAFEKVYSYATGMAVEHLKPLLTTKRCWDDEGSSEDGNYL